MYRNRSDDQYKRYIDNIKCSTVNSGQTKLDETRWTNPI